jgi:hypothetical protein
MTEPLVLSFAEIAFLLRPYADQAERVRRQLSIKDEAASPMVLNSGAASLVARDLCTLSPSGDIVPSAPVIVIAGALATADTFAEAVIFTGGVPAPVHFFGSRGVRVALVPRPFGLFAASQVDAGRPLAEPVLAGFEQHQTGQKVALAVKAESPAGVVTAALVREADGSWFMSDSRRSPDQSLPATRAEAVTRLTDLLGPAPTAVAG